MNDDDWASEAGENLESSDSLDADLSHFRGARLSIPYRWLTLILVGLGIGMALFQTRPDKLDPSLGQHVLFVQDDRVLGVQFSSVGDWLAWTSADGATSVCLPALGRESGVFKYNKKNGVRAQCVAFSPVRNLLATGYEDGSIVVRQPIHSWPDGVFQAHSEAVRTLAFSPDGTLLATGGLDSRVKLWNVSDLSHRATLGEHIGGVNSMVFAPNGDRLASAGDDGRIVVWDRNTGREMATLRRPTGAFRPPRGLVFSPDGIILAAGNQDAMVTFWDVASGQVKSTLEGPSSVVLSIALSPDGKTLAVAGVEGQISLWDFATKKQVGDLRGHRGGICSVAFSPDGKSLASGGWDHTVRLWPLACRDDSMSPSSARTLGRVP
jgi:WD40 repeat protein